MTVPSVEPALVLTGLVRRFGSAEPVVRGVDLTVADGEFFSLIGPSGCGKTTTLRMIAGLEDVTDGKIQVHGQDVTKLPAYKRPVHTVFQQYALFPHLTVSENVAFGLKERKVAKDVVRKRVAEMLDLVELTGRGEARPRELSGGMQQRVALARALVLNPQVLLLDEPLGALDLRLRRQMQILLKTVQREVGITFVYVTHDQEEAFSMSDRVGIMHAGELVQVDTPRAVYEQPASRFVADFVGASNVVPAELVSVESAGRYTVSIPGSQGTSGGTRVVSVAGAMGLELGTPVGIVLRPEAATLSLPGADAAVADGRGAEDGGPGRVGLDGVVEDVSFRGPQTSVLVRCFTADRPGAMGAGGSLVAAGAGVPASEGASRSGEALGVGVSAVAGSDTAVLAGAGTDSTVEVTVVAPSQNIPPGLEPGSAVRVGFRGRDLWAIRP